MLDIYLYNNQLKILKKNYLLNCKQLIDISSPKNFIIDNYKNEIIYLI